MDRQSRKALTRWTEATVCVINCFCATLCPWSSNNLEPVAAISEEKHEKAAAASLAFWIICVTLCWQLILKAPRAVSYRAWWDYLSSWRQVIESQIKKSKNDNPITARPDLSETQLTQRRMIWCHVLIVSLEGTRMVQNIPATLLWPSLRL